MTLPAWSRRLGAVLLLASGWSTAAAITPIPNTLITLINCGVSLEEFLAPAGVTRQYEVDVPPGEVVTVNASDTSGTIGLIKLRGTGAEETCSGTLRLTEPGIALVEATDCLGADTGTFTISASVVSESERNCGHTLPCGATLRVQHFRIAGEVDAHTFHGTAGDQITLTAMDVGGTIGFVRLRVFDPDGVLASEADSCRSSNKVMTLEKTGMYTALASACGLPTTGTYGIALEGTSCPTGPDVTYLGIVADGVPVAPLVYDDEGRPHYVLARDAQVSVVIEGRPGASDQPLGTQAFRSDPLDPTALPDLQVLFARALGDGSTLVCDSSGGVPATEPLEFAVAQPVADAINDFGCRVDDGSGQTQAITDPAQACTHPPEAGPAFVNDISTAQFCAPILPAWSFAEDGTIVRARLRDAEGALGAEREMYVSLVRPPDPCPADCDGNNVVEISELVLCVGIGLGTTTVTACPAVDANWDATVSINEIVQGMLSLMNACPPALSTTER